MCWITQLVVHKDYRERGLATGLLSVLREDDDDIYGVMSSHPAACLAAAKAFSSKRVSLSVGNFIAEYLSQALLLRSDWSLLRSMLRVS